MENAFKTLKVTLIWLFAILLVLSVDDFNPYSFFPGVLIGILLTIHYKSNIDKE